MPILDQLFARRDFSLAYFELLPLEFDEAGEADELLLDQPAGHCTPNAASAIPTAGELRESIERHLRGDSASARRADAADELRNALAELRRSLA